MLYFYYGNIEEHSDYERLNVSRGSQQVWLYSFFDKVCLNHRCIALYFKTIHH